MIPINFPVKKKRLQYPLGQQADTDDNSIRYTSELVLWFGRYRIDIFDEKSLNYTINVHNWQSEIKYQHIKYQFIKLLQKM